MEFSLSGTVLTKDLVAADGQLVASRGEIVDLGTLKDVAAKAPRGVREKPLFETECSQAVLEAFEAPPETASTLAALFAGMAQLLQAPAAPGPRLLAKRGGAAADTTSRPRRSRSRPGSAAR